MLVGGVVNQDQALGATFTMEATAKVGSQILVSHHIH